MAEIARKPSQDCRAGTHLANILILKRTAQQQISVESSQLVVPCCGNPSKLIHYFLHFVKEEIEVQIDKV